MSRPPSSSADPLLSILARDSLVTAGKGSYSARELTVNGGDGLRPLSMVSAGSGRGGGLGGAYGAAPVSPTDLTSYSQKSYTSTTTSSYSNPTQHLRPHSNSTTSRISAPRPLSSLSTTSSHSQSSAQAFRRQSNLLSPLDSPLKHSLSRAAIALKASERSRKEVERRRSQLASRVDDGAMRGGIRSAGGLLMWEHGALPHEKLEAPGVESLTGASKEVWKEDGGRVLRKVRSVPMDLLSPRRAPVPTTTYESTRLSPPTTTGLSHFHPHREKPRKRLVSHDEISSPIMMRSRSPSPVTPTSPNSSGSNNSLPYQRSSDGRDHANAPVYYPRPSHDDREYLPHDSHYSHLPLLVPLPQDPPSKFSASTGNSKLGSLGPFSGGGMFSLGRKKSVEFDRIPFDSSAASGAGEWGEGKDGGSGGGSAKRRRARTLSTATSFRNLLSGGTGGGDKGLKRKGSLATLFGTGRDKAEEPRRRISSEVGGARRESSDSRSTGTPSKPKALFSFRPSISSSQSHTPKSHKRMLSVSSNSTSTASHSTEDSASTKKSWVQKLGRAVSAKRKTIQEESPAQVKFAEKVLANQSKSRIPERRAERIPLHDVFPHVNVAAAVAKAESKQEVVARRTSSIPVPRLRGPISGPLTANAFKPLPAAPLALAKTTSAVAPGSPAGSVRGPPPPVPAKNPMRHSQLPKFKAATISTASAQAQRPTANAAFEDPFPAPSARPTLAATISTASSLLTNLASTHPSSELPVAGQVVKSKPAGLTLLPAAHLRPAGAPKPVPIPHDFDSDSSHSDESSPAQMASKQKRWTPPSPSPSPRPTSAMSLHPIVPRPASALSTRSDDHTASTGSEDTRRHSFRSPSPARFRDFLPSQTAASSPEKNEMDLPQPDDSPRSLGARKGRGKKGDSPKKRAMGPEQVIGMDLERLRDSGEFEEEVEGELKPAGMSMVCGATTDLADLLCGLDDTSELTNSTSTAPSNGSPLRRVKELSPSLRQYLPKTESIESLRSEVSDVPDDLKYLIQSVHDSITESEVEPPTFEYDDEFDDDAEAATPSAQMVFANIDRQSDEGLSSGRTLQGFGLEGNDETASSFEGHISTAASALRSMLAGPGPGESEPRFTRLEKESGDGLVRDSQQGGKGLRDSVQEYLAMERPTIGDKMMERMDIEVSLTSLVAADSPPPSSPERARPSCRPGLYRRSTSPDLTTSSFGSPTPANGLRTSIARYSAGPAPTSKPPRRVLDYSSSEGEEGRESMDSERPPSPPPEDATGMSFAQSTRSTKLSVSSGDSPCPPPRHRRVPMLTGKRAPPPVPTFRFPSKDAGDAKVTPTNNGRPQWIQTHSSTSPKSQEKVGESGSPFKRMFSPLDAFRTKGRQSSAEEVEDESQDERGSPKRSPRFVRPLQPARAGEPVPRPRLLSDSESPSLIPPDTPPPSSPSTSDRDSESIHSSVCSLRDSVEIERAVRVPAALPRGGRRHSRQVSRASSLLQSTIIEEKESPSKSPIRPPRISIDIPDYHLIDVSEERSPFDDPFATSLAFEEIPEEILEESVTSEERKELVVSIYADDSPVDAALPLPLPVPSPAALVRSFSAPLERALPSPSFRELVQSLDGDDDEEEISADVVKKYIHFTYEADMEVKRSRALWPDTERSLAALAHFVVPVNTFEILQFLFDSQDRFVSAIHFHPRLFDQLTSRFGTSFVTESEPLPIEDAREEAEEMDEVVEYAEEEVEEEEPVRAPSPPAKRRPLGERPANRQVDLARSASSPRKVDAFSPFTALPTPIGKKLRGIRAKLSPRKSVDVAFLGEATTKRRKNQFDAAMRKLEGKGRPEEQRSDEGTDDEDSTGVLESTGTISALANFPSATRPRVRRRQGLSMLR